VWEGHISTGQPRPYRKRAGLPHFPILGFPSFLRTLSQNYQIWRGDTSEEGLVFRGQPRPPKEGGSPVLPNFGVLLYLCLHPLTQNDQIWHGNYGEGRVLGGQSHRCICTTASRGLSATTELLVRRGSAGKQMPIIGRVRDISSVWGYWRTVVG